MRVSISWVSIIFAIIVFMAPIAIFSFLSEDARKSSIIYYQTACEVGTVLTLGWYCLSNWASAKETVLPILLISLTCFAIAEFGFNTTFFQKSVEAYRQKAFCAICYSFAFGLMALALVIHFKIYKEHPLVLLGILSIALVHFALQYRYLLVPLREVYFSKLPYFMYLNGVCYSVLTALVAGISITYCLRSLNVGEFIFLHLIMALLTFDFAARYQLVQSTFDKMTMAQCLWALAVGSIFLAILLPYIQGKMIFSFEGQLADWFSIRASLALLVFTITILLSTALLVIRFFTIRNAVDLTLLLTIVLACWSISNVLAFNVSAKFMEIGSLMGTNRVSEVGLDGSPGIHLKIINKRISFASEMNYIIDQYNQMADKFNVRGQILVESINRRILFEKDAVRGHIAKQLAHDIESPLGAIRTMIALPKLDTETAKRLFGSH